MCVIYATGGSVDAETNRSNFGETAKTLGGEGCDAAGSMRDSLRREYDWTACSSFVVKNRRSDCSS